jgi:glycerophosphoryl diester phosphodiesterase
MFDLQGHRGARGLWPENTLAGFARALEIGISGIELDCGLTSDGVPVVTHDPRLNPDCTRDAQGHFLERPGPPVFELTWAQLQLYDVGRLRAGSAYAARFPQQQAIDGERIPRLADVLMMVRTRGRGRVRVSVEVKTFPEQPQLTASPQQFAEALRRDVEASATAALVVVMAFDWRVLRAVRQQMPQVATAALSDEQPGDDTVRLESARPSPWLGGLDPRDFGGSVERLVKASGAGTWGPNYRDLDGARIERAHALGLRVVPWTVNEPGHMERLLALEVDGMITDRPDLLRALLERRGVPVPPLPGLLPEGS